MIKNPKIQETVQKLLGKSNDSLEDLASIDFLDLNNKDIDDISDLILFENLEKVHLFGNPIKDYAPLLQLKKLKSLNVAPSSDDYITPIKKLSLNEIFILNRSNLDIVDEMHDLELLWSCYVRRNSISAISNLINLKKIYLFDNSEIDDISAFEKMLKLEILDYQYNKSHDLSPLRNCMNLEILFIGGNGISDLSPISGLKNLVNLKMTSNPVSDYEPLINLKLKELQIDDCPIADLEIISEIKSIERIVLSHTNTITNILPLLKLNNLKALELNGLQIDDKQIRQIKEKFTSCIIKM